MYQRQQHKKVFCLLILFCALFFSATSFALSSDNDKPMQIVADSTLINYKTGVYTYEGNVKIVQGTTQLIADRVITKNNSNHKMEEAIAYGLKKVAEYSTIPKEGDQLMHASAKIIRFFPPKSTIELEDTVLVTQGENSFQGPFITYNMKDQVVTAPESKGGRATIIIEPNQYKKS